ncbi:response regulator transcription factor [Acuticoccus sp. MNP-M23]|uniref:response regulator transcription factor n=1 Tax=Acuticoccus sp. MNP-M23 TaxID=3072793 RepID=UPI0028162537|nr:response regulator transcription factor [Acuticoccus sp. MNP-M23]WMS41383.1 response regulator transcription factor [Acuticoccus sp. MNP-M23]
MKHEEPGNLVLVVDDAPDTLAMLIDTLEEAGLTVLVARDGSTAISLARRVEPDAILLDALMPGLDGFETCRRLKSGPDATSAPVIFMTGLSGTEHIVAGLAAGGVDYITKPVKVDELIARVAVHVSNARVVREARSALDAVGQPLIAVSRTGVVTWTAANAADMAASVLGSRGRDVVVTDASLIAFVEEVVHTAVSAATPWRAGNGRLTMTYIGRTASGDVLLRIAPGLVADEQRLSERFGLTQRESEVLNWIVKGKSNRDIAEILTLNPGTVNKHLEKILAKLGVENRTAAAVSAVRALGA